jgi:hypothetical protein
MHQTQEQLLIHILKHKERLWCRNYAATQSKTAKKQKLNHK